MTNVLSLAVLAFVVVRLSTGLRRSRTYEGRSVVTAVVRNVRWRHVWPVPLLLATVIAIASGLFLIPGMSWGWWSMLGGSGNPVFGNSDLTTGTPWEWIVPLAFAALLLPALPLWAYAEERVFRTGAEGWSNRHRAWKVLQFGLIHAVVGIPIGAALALSTGGAYFMRVYLRNWSTSHDRNEATIESTTAHTVYNAMILLVLVAAYLHDALA